MSSKVFSELEDIISPDHLKEVSTGIVAYYSPKLAQQLQLICKDVPKEATYLLDVMLVGTAASTACQGHAVSINSLSLAEVQQMGAIAGHKFLQYLDGELHTERLPSCLEKRQCLFVMVFMTALAIDTAHRHLKATITQHYKFWEDMCHHLVKVLLHYCILLGESIQWDSTMTEGSRRVLHALTQRD